MRRTHLQFQAQENEGAENVGTPANAGLITLPRLRLLDKILKSEGYTDSAIINSRSPTSTLAAGNAKNAVEHLPFSHNRICTADRFIVPRRKYGIDASNYLLTKRGPPKVETDYEIDVFKEIEMVDVKWQKDLMHRAMVQENVIPGLGQKKVLPQSRLSSENKLPGIPGTKSTESWIEDYCKEGMWKSKPRKRPSISNAGLVIDTMSPVNRNTLRLRNRLRDRIDWSSKNVVAHAINGKLALFEANQPQLITTHDIEILNSEKICALKWNNAGDQLVICTLLSTINLYDSRSQKFPWYTTCNAPDYKRLPLSCYARCLCWSPDDKFFAVGCLQLITIYCAKTGCKVNSKAAHTERLLSIEISWNSRYIVSTSSDKQIRIFTWPTLMPVFDITYHYCARELAWNPMDNNMLCIGGGLSDGSLSFWDMTTMDIICYRTIDFFGSIDNLAWNKCSGELVVHWTCIDEEHEETIIPVFASLDHVVDAIPVARDVQVHALLWNSDHSQLGVFNDECLSVWNFFGDEYQHRKKNETQRKLKECKKIPTGQQYFRGIHQQYTIR